LKLKDRRRGKLLGYGAKPKFCFGCIGHTELDVCKTIASRENDLAVLGQQDGTLDAGGFDVGLGPCGYTGLHLGGQRSG
jgi:hypothetical protein